MRKLIKNTVAIFALPLFLACCDKKPKPTDYNSLPEYFECYINGKYFTYSNGDAFMQNPDGLKAFSDINGIDISASAKSGWQTASSVNLLVRNLNNLQVVHFGDYYSDGYAHIGRFIDNPNESIETGSTHTGKITFTKNTDTLIEGTFNFKAASQSGFVADVTNGKFKIKI